MPGDQEKDKDKTRKVRGGHRAFVKRTISIIDDLIVKGDLSKDEKDRIVNYRKTLTEKQKVLKSLDGEILNKMTDDDNIEAEIFESSEFSEFIFDAISRIDNLLHAPSQPNIADSSMNSTDGGSHGNLGNQSPVSDSDQSTQNPGQYARLQSNPRIRAKLPKLTLDKYSGDAKQWQSFWDSFSSAIDSNPELSKVDKFSYLKSLLEGPAQSAISGITLTGDNYDSAIKLLTERFANTQIIISSHMESMISLKSVSDSNDSKKLRTLYDGIESSIRNLNSLGISSDSFGALLIPLILQKIPEDFTLLITRELKSDTWSFSEFLHGMKLEIEAREKCAFMKSKEPNQTKTNKPDDFHKFRYKPTTSATLFTDQKTGNTQHGPFCSFCANQHSSASCKTVTEISARRNILRKKGKCFRCLKTGHIIRNCPVSFKCFNCQGDHNAAICDRSKENTATGYKDHKQSNTMCVNSDTSVLLQTAVTDIGSPDNPRKSRSRLVFDNCSQRTYVTDKLCNQIKSKSIREDNLLIKSFGDQSPRLKPCQLVQLSVTTRDGMEIYVNAYKVPTICSPISNQAIDIALDNYPYLHGLDLADNPNASDADELEVDLLIGADYYWTFFNGVSRRGERNGPVALYSKLGWILSGPVVTSCRNSSECTVNLSSTHVLKIDSTIVNDCNDSYDIKKELSKFWDLETLGIKKNETSVYDKFMEDVKFKQERYEVQLPFKEEHSLLPDNFNVCQNRLEKLLRRLKYQPQIREEYDRIIKDQLKDGIIEPVPEQEISTPAVGNVHYLPHREVVRTDKNTTKVRIVYDASAKVNNVSPSLNDCLFSGPSLIPLIFDILIRFRLNRIAVIADIEKAFLNISVVPEHRDFLRFLWVSDPNSDNPNILVYRFARVVFGVTSSPFLLNATLRHHLSVCESDDNSDFIREISESLYVDDFASGSGSVNETFEKCKVVRNIFTDGAFNMRKWVSNSEELIYRINNDLVFKEKIETSNNQIVAEEDEGYSKYCLSQESYSYPKVLGLVWDNKSDNFVFDFSKIADCNESNSVTKRIVLSIASKFYDPLGLISPIVLSFKLLFQKLCTLDIDWDDQLDDDFVIEWKNLLSKLQKANTVEIPRCYCIDICDNSGIELHVFGDASERAFGTCIYLRCNHGTFIHSNLIASKTRVAPLSKQTMPRLELLACLISAQLAVSVVKALHNLNIDQIYYWSDSQVALSWIRNINKEYKQFVQNRVTEIRKISTIENWNYCPTSENPADIASRGSTSTELAKNIKWWNGPQYLLLPNEEWPNQLTFEQIGHLDNELKIKSMSVVSCVASSRNNQPNPNLEEIIPLTKFSSLSTLLRVTAYVLRFVHNVKCRVNQNQSDHQGDLSLEELKISENLWIQDIQYHIARDDKFKQRTVSLNLKEDDSGILRCYGRIEHSNLEFDAKNPVFLPEKNHFTYLQILKSHQDVMHNGVQETLSQLRSKFWVVRGRQVVRSIVSKCVICRRLEAKSYGTPIQPPLPAFRISDDFAFSHIGIDYAGPLFVRDIYSKSEDMHKVYIVIYTCASSRAIHLDLAPDASSTSFIRSFKRFIGRRGIPTSVISDNGKTFKGVELKSFNASKSIRWRFNVERSPWWGGFFERMVRSVKRCLKKSLGTSRLTYEELLTLLIQIEGVLNSRPLTYLCDDGGEPLTPSQLVIGRRLLSEPVETLEPNIRDLSTFTRRKYLKTVLEHFWNRWKREYLTELREHHKFNTSKGQSVRVGDVVLVFEDKIPRHNWNIARIERTLEGRDGNIRSAVIRMLDKSGKPILMNRPIQKLYPIELSDN